MNFIIKIVTWKCTIINQNFHLKFTQHKSEHHIYMRYCWKWNEITKRWATEVSWVAATYDHALCCFSCAPSKIYSSQFSKKQLFSFFLCLCGKLHLNFRSNLESTRHMSLLFHLPSPFQKIYLLKSERVRAPSKRDRSKTLKFLLSTFLSRHFARNFCCFFFPWPLNSISSRSSGDNSRKLFMIYDQDENRTDYVNFYAFSTTICVQMEIQRREDVF